jgi:hypothetical protein
MTSLSQAHTLSDQIDAAQQQLKTYLRPTLQEYIDFLPQRGTGWTPSKYTQAEDYSFREIEHSAFVFESEEFHEYGESVRDVVELPFAFIDAPESFKTNLLESMAAAAKKRTEKNREAAEKRIAHLRRQLEVEEAKIAKEK